MFLRFVLILCLSQWVALRPSSGQEVLDYENEPILYSKSTPNNSVSRLNAKLASGKAALQYDARFGYLPSVLEALKVPVSSQVLTFAQTSLQADRIRPKHPRALYFSDDVFVGYVHGSEEGHHGPAVLELAVTDPALGVVFYSLPQTKSDTPTLTRESNRCLTCHGGPRSRGVPGLFIRSVVPDPEGRPVLAAGSFRTDHGTPFAQRWGGWYVTGKHGEQRHLGNFTLPTSKKPKKLENPDGQNVINIADKIDTKEYLTPQSDLVALMVMEHQIDAINYMTRARFEHRLAASGQGSGDRVRDAVELLVRQLHFVGEAKLTSQIEGVSPFAKEFAKRGPVDSSGRSLRTFDLQKRMFKYPISYMIESAAFDSLQEDLKAMVWQRMWSILTTAEADPEFDHLSTADRRAVLEILRDTRRDLPEPWKQFRK